MSQARKPAGTTAGGQFAPMGRPAASGLDLSDDDLIEAAEPTGQSAEPTGQSAEKRLAALRPLCRYGSNYDRGVAEAVSDHLHFASFHEDDASEHYLLLAELRAGYIDWEDFYEKDSLERINHERQLAAATKAAGPLHIDELPVDTFGEGDLIWYDESFFEVLEPPVDASAAGRMVKRFVAQRQDSMGTDRRSIDFVAGSTAIGWQHRGDSGDAAKDQVPAAEPAPAPVPALAPKLSGENAIARIFPDGEPNRGVRRHKLLTAELVEQMPGLYESEGTPVADKLIYAHYFTASADWHIAELDRETGEMFGRCDLGMGFPEWGYVTIHELAQLRAQFGLPVERDLDFTPKTARELGLVEERR